MVDTNYCFRLFDFAKSCVAEQEEKQYREGTVILEITKRDAA